MAIDVEPGLEQPGMRSAAGRRLTRLGVRLLMLVVFLGALIALGSLVLDSGVVGDRRPGRVLFTDVPESNPHRRQVEQIARLGFLPGVTDHTFAPRATVSRATLAEVVVRAMNWPVAAGEKQPYKDVEGVSSRLDSSDYIAVASAQNVLGRAAPGGPALFKPDQAVTLEQAVQALVRAGRGQLTAPKQMDPAIAKLKVAADVKTALSTAKANDLFKDSGIDAASADLSRPITREQLAVLMSNYRAVVTPAPSG